MKTGLQNKYGRECWEGEESLIEKVLEYINSNYQRKLTLDEVADFVHMNRSYLSRVYKKKTGENLFDTINRKRVEVAKKYIREGNRKMWEIGAMVGVDDAAHFSKMFKRFTGYSPQDWRRVTGQADEEE